jgi:hypothetical protein
MVWGMNLPSGLGDFSPSGDFEFDRKTRNTGWFDRLRLFYLEQTPEEQRRLFDYGDKHVGHGAAGYWPYAVGKFITEPGTRESSDRPLTTPIEPHEAPISFDTDKSYKALGSLIEFTCRILAVDEALKAIIERLEPGVHQFFPIEIRMPRDNVYPAQYYTFVIGQYLDSFSPDDSDKWSWHDYPDHPDFYYYHYRKDKSGITGLALKKTLFQPAILWRERRFNGILICLSDELQAEIASAGLRIPRHYRMKEV